MNISTDKFMSLETACASRFSRSIKEVSDDFPWACALLKIREGGISIKESPTIAGILAEAGLTYISVSAGIYETEHIGHDGMDKPEGWKMYMWKAIKEAVNIPVIGGGGMKRPSFCEGFSR
jgi:2,4-dienoyl-CoA reductase-like NADH-dependent reductase (Old Yellow Enzyme family)